MATDETASAQAATTSGAPDAAAPAASAGSEPSPGARLRAALTGLAGLWPAALGFGFLFWALSIAMGLFVLGAFDHLRSSRNGVVRIESPQIYTRERLVNDRFREQAWLETQLEALKVAPISSSRSDRATGGGTLNFRAGQDGANPGEAEDGEQPAASGAPEPGARPENGEASNAGSPAATPDAVDVFWRDQNARQAIRRELIENELDDRHDLGANSLYQMNFGAAIVAGPRTRQIASIEMDLKPVDPLRALNTLIVDPASRCDGLIEFECAFLFDVGLLRKPEQAERERWDDYRRWQGLFKDWLAAENASYARESGDIRDLLRSSQANGQIEMLLRPFLLNLNRRAEAYVDNLIQVVDPETRAHLIEQCRYYPPEWYTALLPVQARALETASVYGRLEAFIRACIQATNQVVKDSARPNRLASFVARHVFAPTFASFGDEDTPRILVTNLSLNDQWDQFFKYSFRGFNDQCQWFEPIVSPKLGGEEASDPIRINPFVQDDLLQCIINSVVRDHGSHPFSHVTRLDLSPSAQISLGTPPVNRSGPSSYAAPSTIQSVVVASSYGDVRTSERFESVGIHSRAPGSTPGTTDGDGAQPVSMSSALLPLGEFYPNDPAALTAKCARLGIEIDPADVNRLSLARGYFSSDIGLTASVVVDGDLGWNFLEFFICSYLQESLAPGAFQIPIASQIPIGLFRFIHSLSSRQGTFSYAVVPSGEFRLQQRSSDISWNWRSVFGSDTVDGGVNHAQNTRESWVDKNYRVIGFATQTGQPSDASSAGFGWYLFPARPSGLLFGPAVIESANVKLSALVSVPGWWKGVEVTARVKWLDPVTLEEYAASPAGAAPETFRIDLPVRLEYIRNHFPSADTTRPSLYDLHVPQMTVRACNKAEIVLKGERLWRSTVVTLGGQKANLIQVMPDMRGIIATFDRIDPDSVSNRVTTETAATPQTRGAGDTAAPIAAEAQPEAIPVTIWTSEGQATIFNAVTLQIPDSVKKAMGEGLKACVEP